MKRSHYLATMFLTLVLTSYAGADAEEKTPSAVFLAYHKLLLSTNNPADLEPYQSSAAKKKFSSPTFIDLQAIKALTPRATRVLSEQIEGDRATVTMEGISQLTADAKEKSKTIGKIRMVRKWSLEN